jgi:hypothetical protein
MAYRKSPGVMLTHLRNISITPTSRATIIQQRKQHTDMDKLLTSRNYIRCGNTWIKKNHISAFRITDNKTIIIYAGNGHVINGYFSEEKDCNDWINKILGKSNKYFNDVDEDGSDLYKKYLENKLNNNY